MPSPKLVDELHLIIQRNRAKTGLAPLVQCEKCWRWNEPQVPCLKCKQSRLSLEALTLRNREIERRQQLFDQDPFCGTCRKPIEKVEDCANIKLATGVEFIQHNACFKTWLDAAALRYFGRAS